jgi:Protein of unknown function (DUF4236)
MGKVSFRKSFKIGGARITVTPKGIGTSVGVKGLRVGRGVDGRTRASASLPGTGLSYRHTVNRQQATGQAKPPVPPGPTPARRSLPWWVWVLIGLLVLGLLSVLG